MIALFANDLRMLLAVMVKSLESLRARLPQDGTFDQDLDELEGAIDGAYYVCRELMPMRETWGIEPAVLDVNELIMQACGVLERSLGTDIRLVLNLSAEAPIVTADAVPMECMLLNLIANAREAMPNGGIVTIHTTLIDMVPTSKLSDSPRARKYVRLTISDTGAGMTPELQNRASEPFFTTKSDRPGLGLTSVMTTVRRLGGFVELASEVQSGTQVHLYLPALGPQRT